MIIEEGVYLEHFGVKGMQWGVRKERKRAQREMQDAVWGKTRKERRANARAGFKELRDYQSRNRAAEKAARKDPTFRREVKATKKRRGIDVEDVDFEVTKNGELLTGRMLGKFRNSKGERVSTDFANAVLNKASQSKQTKRNIATGLSVASILMIKHGAKLVRK